jgi:chromate transporter
MALGAAAFLIVVPGALWQVALILLGLLLGWLLFRGKVELTGEGTDENEGKDRQISGDEAVGAGASAARRRPASGTGWPLIAGFFALLFGLPMLAGTPEGSSAWLAIVDGFYRAGSLVFGGGHVVLPLLDSFTVARGWISSDAFLAGYGVAQAIPGPLFTFSAFLGASFEVGPGGVWGGLLALLAIYVPSFLLVLGVLPYWERIRRVRAARAALLGANAVVVGLLLAAFYNPIWTAAGTDAGRVGFALVAFALLRFAKVPPWALVIACGLAGGGLALGPIDVPGIF